MSQEILERLRAGYGAFSQAGKLSGDFFARDFEMSQASSLVGAAGVFRGPKAIRDSLVEVEVALEQLSFEPEQLIEAPDGKIVVYVHVRARGRGSGIEVDNHIAHVWTLSGRFGGPPDGL